MIECVAQGATFRVHWGWVMFLLGYNMSVASAVGFIALGGAAAEIGIVMLVYLEHSVASRKTKGQLQTERDLTQAIVDGGAGRPLTSSCSERDSR